MASDLICRAKLQNWKESDNEEQWVYGYYVRGIDAYENPIHIIFDPTTIFFDDGKTDGWHVIDPDTLCSYVGVDNNDNMIFENDVMKDCIVIGNVFDNPELM